MAILTPSQLVSASNATYFDNTSGSITPTSVRSLNDNWISSSILASQTSSLTVLSSSYALSASYALKATTADSATTAQTASYVLNAVSASRATSALNADTASSADQFNVRTALTASGLRYPTVDNGIKSFIQTDGAGNLSLQYVDTIWESVRAGENVVKGTPLYISGSQGAAPIVYAADAANPAKMPVTFIAGEAYTAGTTYNAIVLGLIEGLDLTGYTAGQTVYVAEGGGWTTSLPSGSNSITQVLGVVTKGGSGGKGLVLNPGPAQLPGLQTGYTWVGNGSNRPVAVPTSSIQNVVSASYALTASFALNGGGTSIDTGSFATTGSNTFTGTNSFNIISASFANVVSASIEYLSVIYQTSSVIFSSGSNIFGDNANDTQTLYGTVDIKTGPLYMPSGSAVKFQMNTSTQSLQLQKHNVLNELIVINPDSNEKIIGFDYDTLRTKIQFGIDTGIRFEGIDAKGRTINISSSIDIQNTLNVLGDTLITGSLVMEPSQISTEFPFVISQVSDGTSRGGNLISARNTSISSTGSVIVSGSQNLILLSAGGDTSEFGTGSAGGFTATNSIVTSVPFITGSNGSGYDRPLPTFTNSLVSAPLTVTDNRPSTTTTPLTIQQGNVNANISFTTSTGSALVNRAVLAGTGVVLTVTGSNGATKNISSIGVVGNTNTLLIDSPSAAASYTGLFIAGTSNTVLVSGSNTTMQSANLLGYQLRATGSATATTNYGSLFAGRWNAIDNTALTKETAFLVGTGAANATRRTSFHVSASGLTTVSNGLTVTGSTSSSFNVASTFNQTTTFNQSTAFNQTPSFNTQANFGNVLSFTGSRFAAPTNNTNDLEALDANRFGINIRSKNFSTSGSEYFITVNTGSNSTSHTLNAQYGGTVGSVVLSNSTGSTLFAVTANTISMSGSLRGNVVSASIASNTSSLDFSQGNFYTSLVTGTTNFNITNPGVGQTVNLLLTTAGTGASASFSSNVKQISGSVYTPTSTAGAQDILTFISWDGSSVYLANVKNLI